MGWPPAWPAERIAVLDPLHPLRKRPERRAEPKLSRGRLPRRFLVQRRQASRCRCAVRTAIGVVTKKAVDAKNPSPVSEMSEPELPHGRTLLGQHAKRRRRAPDELGERTRDLCGVARLVGWRAAPSSRPPSTPAFRRRASPPARRPPARRRGRPCAGARRRRRHHHHARARRRRREGVASGRSKDRLRHPASSARGHPAAEGGARRHAPRLASRSSSAEEAHVGQPPRRARSPHRRADRSGGHFAGGLCAQHGAAARLARTDATTARRAFATSGFAPSTCPRTSRARAPRRPLVTST